MKKLFFAFSVVIFWIICQCLIFAPAIEAYGYFPTSSSVFTKNKLPENLNIEYYASFIQAADFVIQGTTTNNMNPLGINGISATLINIDSGTTQEMRVGATTVAGRVNYSLNSASLEVGKYKVKISKEGIDSLITVNELNLKVDMKNGKIAELSVADGVLQLEVKTDNEIYVEYYAGFIQGKDFIIQGTTTNGSSSVGISGVSGVLKNVETGTVQEMKIGATTVLGRINYSLDIGNLQLGTYEIEVNRSSIQSVITANELSAGIDLKNGKIAELKTSPNGTLEIEIKSDNNLYIEYYAGFVQKNEVVVQGTTTNGVGTLGTNGINAVLKNIETGEIQEMKIGATTVAGRINYSLNVSDWQMGMYEIEVSRSDVESIISTNKLSVEIDLKNGKIAEFGSSVNGMLQITIKADGNFQVEYYAGFIQSSDFVIQGTTTNGLNPLGIDKISATLKNIETGNVQEMKVSATTVGGRINYSLAVNSWQLGTYEVIINRGDISSFMSSSDTTNNFWILPGTGKSITINYVNHKVQIAVKEVELSASFLFAMNQDGQFKIQADTQSKDGYVNSADVQAVLKNVDTEMETAMLIGGTTKPGYINYALSANMWDIGEYEIIVRNSNFNTKLSYNLTDSQKFWINGTNKIIELVSIEGFLKIKVSLRTNVDYSYSAHASQFTFFGGTLKFNGTYPTASSSTNSISKAYAYTLKDINNAEYNYYNYSSADMGMTFEQLKDGQYLVYLKDKSLVSAVQPIIYTGNLNESVMYTIRKNGYAKKVVITKDYNNQTMITITTVAANSFYDADIIIDPGHGNISGSSQPGACSPYLSSGYWGSNCEREVMLRLGKWLEYRLEQHGLKVELTRDSANSNYTPSWGYTGDRDYIAKTTQVLDSHAKISLSLHFNASGSSNARGYDIYRSQFVSSSNRYDISFDQRTSFQQRLYGNVKAYTNAYAVGLRSRDYCDDEGSNCQWGTKDYYYMIREYGGRITGATYGDRNRWYSDYNQVPNPLLLEFFYGTNYSDANNFESDFKNRAYYVETIVKSITEQYGIKYDNKYGLTSTGLMNVPSYTEVNYDQLLEHNQLKGDKAEE